VAQIAFAPDVFTWPSDDPQLLGGRCAECGSVTFPCPTSCARCGSVDVVSHPLPRHGMLWTFTTQGFLPKEPYAGGETAETFEAFGVGLVQLGDEVRVEPGKNQIRIIPYGVHGRLKWLDFDRSESTIPPGATAGSLVEWVIKMPEK